MNEEQKAETNRQMRMYDKTFVAKEYAYNKREGKYGEITMQNLAGMFVKCDIFRSHWVYRDCVLFDNEKEMLVHKIKNENK